MLYLYVYVSNFVIIVIFYTPIFKLYIYICIFCSYIEEVTTSLTKDHGLRKCLNV